MAINRQDCGGLRLAMAGMISRHWQNRFVEYGRTSGVVRNAPDESCRGRSTGGGVIAGTEVGYISSLPFTTMSFSLNLYLRFEEPSFVVNSTSLSSTVKGIDRGNAKTTSVVFPGLLTSI